MVSWSDREVRPLCLVVLLLVSGSIALGPTVLLAGEPFGHVRLHADWSDGAAAESTSPDATPRKLRLSLSSLVPLDEVELTVSHPPALSVKAVEPALDDKFVTVAADETQRAIRADLDRLDAGKPLAVEFEITRPTQRGGVVSFSVEGTTADGRRLREAVGFAAGGAGAAGTHRLGVLEFPATVLPAEEPQ